MVSFNASLNIPSHASAHSRRGSAQAQGNTVDPASETTTAAPSTSTTAASGAPDFRALFTGVTTPEPSKPSQQQPAAPTAESVFGEKPWVENPTGVGPQGVYSYNPIYFATPQTAAKVAQMLGGKVVTNNQFTTGGAFAQQQPNYMVELPDGRQINPGLVAGFYTHGYPQSYIDQLIAGAVNEAPGAVNNT